MGNRSSRDEEAPAAQSRLYDSCEWDDRVVKRMIKHGQLGPRMRGAEDGDDTLEECPICFLNYPSLNLALCCRKRLCTECLLQVKPPTPVRASPCPFCNATTLKTVFKGPQSEAERRASEDEDRRFNEIQQRIRQEELERERERELERQLNPPPPAPVVAPPPAPLEPPPSLSPASVLAQSRNSASSSHYHSRHAHHRRSRSSTRGSGSQHEERQSIPAPAQTDIELEQIFLEIAIQNSLADMATSTDQAPEPPASIPLLESASNSDFSSSVPSTAPTQLHDEHSTLEIVSAQPPVRSSVVPNDLSDFDDDDDEEMLAQAIAMSLVREDSDVTDSDNTLMRVPLYISSDEPDAVLPTRAVLEVDPQPTPQPQPQLRQVETADPQPTSSMQTDGSTEPVEFFVVETANDLCVNTAPNLDGEVTAAILVPTESSSPSPSPPSVSLSPRLQDSIELVLSTPLDEAPSKSTSVALDIFSIGCSQNCEDVVDAHALNDSNNMINNLTMSEKLTDMFLPLTASIEFLHDDNGGCGDAEVVEPAVQSTIASEFQMPVAADEAI